MSRRIHKPTTLYWQRLNHPYWYCKLVYVYHDGITQETSELFYTEGMLINRSKRGDYVPKFWQPTTVAEVKRDINDLDAFLYPDAA